MAGSLMIFVVATENFRSVDRLLDASTNPTFRSLADQLGHARGRELLRYLSSELNRTYFHLWNIAQLGLGFLVLWLIGPVASLGHARRVVLGMMAVVALMLVWMTPEITSLGRSLDFVPREPTPPALSRFWMLHAAYTVLEIGKLFAGGLVTMWIVRNEMTPIAGRAAA
jgi:hypothetical protein